MSGRQQMFAILGVTAVLVGLWMWREWVVYREAARRLDEELRLVEQATEKLRRIVEGGRRP